jgi:putative nucleotidyltransferase with HDIG domain
MNIVEVYKKYKIPGMLQLHQLRVTAVASQICESLTTPVDKKSLIKACLLHDMGNIIKFEFNYPDEFYTPEGRDYWRNVQAEYFKDYGRDEHAASIEIARKLGSNQKILKVIDSIGFSKIKDSHHLGSIEMKLAEYADMRAGPKGIFSIDERMADGQKRYQHRKNYFLKEDERKDIATALHEMEDEIFSKSKLKPSDITDESVAPLIEQLKSYEI